MIVNTTTEKAQDQKSVWLNFGYFKHGDELVGHWDDCKDHTEALRRHAEVLRDYADYCDELSTALRDFTPSQITLDGGAHMVYLHGPSSVCDMLIEKELATKDEFDEDEGDDYEEDYDDEQSDDDFDDDFNDEPEDRV